MLTWLASLGTTVDIQFVSFAVLQLVAVISAYYGLKADNARLGARLELSMVTERAERISEALTMKESVMLTIATVQGAVNDLMHRIGTLESGQDEWTKSLRSRTHDLSEQINTLVLKVDRLERPTGR